MQLVAILHRSPTSFGVSFPDLPGCTSAGDTEQLALENAAEAVSAHLAELHAHGDTIPLPRDLDTVRRDPAFAEDFKDHVAVALVPYHPPARAVRVNVTIDESLLAAIDRAAQARGLSRSGYLAEAARSQLSGR